MDLINKIVDETVRLNLEGFPFWKALEMAKELYNYAETKEAR